ncbi:MAG TPA: hypothetical protein VM450_11365 [Thermomicrobiales bacterium]|nr:hypothetical protein [Thermomicrobiales bacterium]
MAITYEPATPEEVALVLEAFYAKGNIPTGFAVNRNWNPMVRRIAGATVDPEELAALKAARTIKGAEFDAFGFDALTAKLKGLTRAAASYYFADDFERPDTTGSTSPSNTGLGNGWQITGSGYLTGRINDGAYVNSGNTYVWRQLAWTPYRMSMLASFSGSSRALVLIASPDSNLFHNAVHIFFSPTQALLQIRQANVATTITTVPISIATDNVVHEFAFEISGTTVIAFIDGAEIGRATHANIPTLMGPYVTYQIAGNASEPTTPRVEFVEAVKKIA